MPKRNEAETVRYVAWLTQRGEGCDYTIACGQKLISLHATTEDGAKEELKTLVTGEYTDDSQLKAVRLIACVGEPQPMPIGQWYEEAARREAEEDRAAHEQRERLELSRLQEKYGQSKAR